MIESLEEACTGRDIDMACLILDDFRRRFVKYEPAESLPTGHMSEATYTVDGDPDEVEAFVDDALTKVVTCGLYALQQALYEWGKDVFHYDRHPVESLMAHARKEMDEIAVNPDNPEEYADLLILFLQAVSYSRFSLFEVIQAAWEKFAVIQRRHYGKPGPDGTIEHDRSGEPEKEHAAERIAACVRACDGIPTRALQYGIIHQLLEACEHGLAYVDAYRVTERERELLRSRFLHVLTKAEDRSRKEVHRGGRKTV